MDPTGSSARSKTSSSHARSPQRPTRPSSSARHSISTIWPTSSPVHGGSLAQWSACLYAHGCSQWFPATRIVERVNRGQLSDLEVIGGQLSPACYIDQSLPAVLYLAARYCDDFEAALIANTNVGGDNCHRGAVLAHCWVRRWGLRRFRSVGYPVWQAAELKQEIESFMSQFG